MVQSSVTKQKKLVEKIQETLDGVKMEEGTIKWKDEVLNFED